MSNAPEQNGRQTTPNTQPTAPPTDPRRKNVTVPSSAPPDQEICRDFIWGICYMGSQCRHRHQLDYETMRSVLKFCHDFQNRSGCNRPVCKHLHTTKEEHNLFLTSGVIPRVLAERYAEISRLSGSTEQAAAGPQMMYEYGPQLQPLPVPSLPTPAPAPASQPHTPAPAPAPAPAPIPPTMPIATPLAPLLVPPPPPPPPTTVTTSAINVPPVYTGPSMPPAPGPQPPPMLPPTFDPSRPPPPLPPQQNHGMKRPADNTEAGPSCKLRISDAATDTICDSCLHRQIRIQIYKQEMEKMQQEEAIQRIMYEKKTEEYENGKLLLKSALNPQLYRIVEAYVDGNTSQTKPSAFTPGTPTVPLQFLMQLIKCVLGGNLGSSIDSCELPSTSQQGGSPDMLQALLSALCNNKSSDEAVAGPSGVVPAANTVSRLASVAGAAPSPGATPAAPLPQYPPPTPPAYLPYPPMPMPPPPRTTGAMPPPPPPITPRMTVAQPAPPPTPAPRLPYIQHYGARPTPALHQYPHQQFPTRYPPYYPPTPPQQ